MGKVLPVGGVAQKVRAAYDAGLKEMLLPADNLREAQSLPAYILDAVKVTPVQTVDEALQTALISSSRSCGSWIYSSGPRSPDTPDAESALVGRISAGDSWEDVSLATAVDRC